MISVIDAKLFETIVKSGYANLENHKHAVNNLNVFPVPDGDTGTNMALTIQYAVKEIEKAEAKTLSEAAGACSNGALMGARGNSGVILSQLFRGFAKSCKGKSTMDAADFSEALSSASEMAYKAVMKPTEGTVLTVAREMAEYAAENVKSFADISELLDKTIQRGYQSLANTPNLLQVLKEAGVVDAGGQGLLFIFEGMLHALRGEAVELKESVEVVESTEFGMDINSEITYAYCTEFLIMTKNNQNYEKMLIDRLIKMGDSLVVVQDENIVKVHVHTNQPWAAMKLAARIGELAKIKIENMRQQHSELFQNEAKAESVAVKTYSQEEAEYVLVSVSAGEGLGNILKDLGVNYIIEGGQTMNPSTQDFLDIIENTNAKNYILLPNNKNIILAATQAMQISDKNVRVLETKTIPEAISALMNFNPMTDADDNIAQMSAAIEFVKTGQVTFAVRDSSVNGINIQQGDIIGILQNDIVLSEKDVQAAALDLIEKMVDEDSELLTVYYGDEINAKQAEDIRDMITQKHPSLDVELFYGGQPLYYYIISVE